MNHRETPHHPARRREALGCLALMLLAPMGAKALPRPGSPKTHSPHGANPTVYLPVVGAPQLRFQPKPIVAEAPAKVAASPAVASPATPSSPANDFIIPKLPDAKDHGTEAAAQNVVEKTPATTPPPATKPPPAIITDELRPAARAEDFLPYFQMPGSARTSRDVNLLMPAPGSAPTPAAIPPSSATYTQTPK